MRRGSQTDTSSRLHLEFAFKGTTPTSVPDGVEHTPHRRSDAPAFNGPVGQSRRLHVESTVLRPPTVTRRVVEHRDAAQHQLHACRHTRRCRTTVRVATRPRIAAAAAGAALTRCCHTKVAATTSPRGVVEHRRHGLHRMPCGPHDPDCFCCYTN